jgi:hypothetical protein
MRVARELLKPVRFQSERPVRVEDAVLNNVWGNVWGSDSTGRIHVNSNSGKNRWHLAPELLVVRYSIWRQNMGPASSVCHRHLIQQGSSFRSEQIRRGALKDVLPSASCSTTTRNTSRSGIRRSNTSEPRPRCSRSSFVRPSQLPRFKCVRRQFRLITRTD